MCGDIDESCCQGRMDYKTSRISEITRNSPSASDLAGATDKRHRSFQKTEETRGTCDNVSILTLYWKINNDNEQWQTRQILQMHFISWLVTGFWLRPFNVQASTLCLRFQNNIWREGACREPAFLSSLCARLCEC